MASSDPARLESLPAEREQPPHELSDAQKACPHPAGRVYEVPAIAARANCGLNAFRLCFDCGGWEELQGRRFLAIKTHPYTLKWWQYERAAGQIRENMGVTDLPRKRLNIGG